MSKIIYKDHCIFCKNTATWVRYTQFAGDHPMCDDHARKEEDFGQDDSYEYWVESKDGFLTINGRCTILEDNKHSTTINVYSERPS